MATINKIEIDGFKAFPNNFSIDIKTIEMTIFALYL